MNKKVILSLFVLILISTVLANTSVYDDKFGLVTSELDKCGFLCSLFVPNEIIAPSQITLGQSAKITSRIQCPITPSGGTTIILELSGPVSSTIEMTESNVQAGVDYLNEITFNPSKAGTYYIRHCWECGNLETFCDPVKTVTVIGDSPDDGSGVQCPTGYPYYCGNNMCGTTQGWCTNYNNPQFSCTPDVSKCCYDAGYVYDYPTNICCPPNYPFYNPSTNLCYNVPQVGSTNWFTENYIKCIVDSDCASGEKCLKSGDWRNWVCGVEGPKCGNGICETGETKTNCIADCNDCDLNDEKCEGTIWYVCKDSVPNLPGGNEWYSFGEVVGKCGFTEPEEKIVVYRMMFNSCSPVEILPSERINDDYDTLAECEENIEDGGDGNDGGDGGGSFPIDSENIWIFIIIGLVVLIPIFLVIISKLKKK